MALSPDFRLGTESRFFKPNLQKRETHTSYHTHKHSNNNMFKIARRKFGLALREGHTLTPSESPWMVPCLLLWPSLQPQSVWENDKS